MSSVARRKREITDYRPSFSPLTMDTYGHLFPGQEAETVARFPRMLGDAPEDLRATGTAESTASLGEHLGEQLGGECRQWGARRDEKDGVALAAQQTGDSEAQPVALARNVKSRQSVATVGERRRARDSNPQPFARHLISSQAASQFAYPPGGSSQFSFPRTSWQEHPARLRWEEAYLTPLVEGLSFAQ